MQFELTRPPNFLEIKGQGVSVDIGSLNPEEFRYFAAGMHQQLREHWLKRRAQYSEESAKTLAQQANYEICPKCGGAGQVYMCAEDGDGIKCHRCNGSGKLS